MAHPVLYYASLPYCPVCHLLSPCYDGLLLDPRWPRSSNVAARAASLKTWFDDHTAPPPWLSPEPEPEPKQRGAQRLHDFCRKGHPLSGPNLLIESGVRRCLSCRTDTRQRHLRTHHRPHPTETGVCRKGLHAWTLANWIVDAKTGATHCRPCRLIAYHTNYPLKTNIRCVVKGCNAATHRQGGTYICKTHRAQPPAWIAKLGMHIEGTQLVPNHTPASKMGLPARSIR